MTEKKSIQNMWSKLACKASCRHNESTLLLVIPSSHNATRTIDSSTQMEFLKLASSKLKGTFSLTFFKKTGCSVQHHGHLLFTKAAQDDHRVFFMASYLLLGSLRGDFRQDIR